MKNKVEIAFYLTDGTRWTYGTIKGTITSPCPYNEGHFIWLPNVLGTHVIFNQDRMRAEITAIEHEVVRGSDGSYSSNPTAYARWQNLFAPNDFREASDDLEQILKKLSMSESGLATYLHGVAEEVVPGWEDCCLLPNPRIPDDLKN